MMLSLPVFLKVIRYFLPYREVCTLGRKDAIGECLSVEQPHTHIWSDCIIVFVCSIYLHNRYAIVQPLLVAIALSSSESNLFVSELSLIVFGWLASNALNTTNTDSLVSFLENEMSMAQEIVHTFHGKIHVSHKDDMIIFTVILKLAK